LPDREALAQTLARDAARLRAGIERVLERARADLQTEQGALHVQAPTARLAAQRERLVGLARALARESRARSERGRARLGAAVGRLESLSPLAVLGRGYAIARRARDGAIVRRAGEVAPGDALAIRVSEGEIEADVRAVRPPRNG
jgi:exodeoxyribonuclease VII large subunit